MKLIDHKPLPDGKWQFDFDSGQSLILWETWDEVLIGQPLEAVDRWFKARYGWACQFLAAFGAIVDVTM
jgi:hypothetical protein